MEKMKDAVNAAASGEGIPTRRIAGDAGREYILQTTDDVKPTDQADAGQRTAWLGSALFRPSACALACIELIV